MIRLNNISKSFGDKKVIDNLSLAIEDGEIVGIVGKTGIGKTTLINIISGLINQDSGNLSGCDKIAMMFQEDRLLEWYSVYENLSIILKEDSIIDKWLNALKIIDIKDKRISELSGGTKRKVALIRALAFDSDIVLLDEPFTGIDKRGKEEIIDIIKDYQKKRNKIIILISHDIDDLLKLANNVIIFSKGLKIVEKVEVNAKNIEYIKELVDNLE